MKQQTIRNRLVLSGKNPRNAFTVVTLKPAPEDHGILCITPKGAAVAHINNAIERTYGIALRHKRRVIVSVVEHWFAAFYALGIDNLSMELTTDMPPYFDNVAAGIINELRSDVVPQEKDRRVIRLPEFHFKHKGGPDALTVLPNPNFILTGVFEHPKARFVKRQKYTWDGRFESFEKDLMSARTNVLLNPAMRVLFRAASRLGLHSLNESNSLISLGNRWKNVPHYGGEEPVRHFVLDRIGALALLPFRIKGHLIFEKTGHSFDIEALRALCAQTLR